MLGQHIRAEALAASITDPYERARALVAVAGALAEAGQYERAETVAYFITDPGGQARAAVAAALAKARQYEQIAAMASQAETVARSITDSYWRVQALAAVAGALAEAGQYERAETVAYFITDRTSRRGRWRRWRGVAEAGQYERAETVARSITNPGGRARALAAVAGALAARGDIRQAHHLASAACAVGQWTTVLELVLSLEPTALGELTEF